MFKLENEQDIKDFNAGCCFFGTGGGGNSFFGEKMLNDALKLGKVMTIIDASDVADEQWIVCPYLMGTSGAETEETKKQKIQYGLTEPTVSNMPYAAVQLLLKSNPNDVTLSAIIPYEVGAAATSSAVAAAALLDIPTIDADFIGRSVPEATQMLPALYGLNLCPTACADAYGNESLITNVTNRHILERMGKYAASASFGLIGQATLLEKSKDIKPYMIKGTLSKAFKVGKALSQAQQSNSNPDAILAELTGAKKIFEGIISAYEGSDEEGYYVGHIHLTGEGENKESNMKIWFKNENHIAWIDDDVCVTSPDLISIIDYETYVPYVNNELKVGMHITVYGTPSHDAWKEEKALAANCPRYYGYDIETKLI